MSDFNRISQLPPELEIGVPFRHQKLSSAPKLIWTRDCFCGTILPPDSPEYSCRHILKPRLTKETGSDWKLALYTVSEETYHWLSKNPVPGFRV